MKAGPQQVLGPFFPFVAGAVWLVFAGAVCGTAGSMAKHENDSKQETCYCFIVLLSDKHLSQLPVRGWNLANPTPMTPSNRVV